MRSSVRYFLLVWVSIFSVMMVSCGGGYDGYMRQSYRVRGGKYYPMTVDQALTYREEGVASWYDESRFFGFKRGNTSLGEKVMPWHISAAHKTLPLPCVVKVTNLSNGKSLKMRVNDRGPFIGDRIIDLSPRAAKKLGFKKQGLTQVRVEVVSVGDGKYKRKPKRKSWFHFW